MSEQPGHDPQRDPNVPDPAAPSGFSFPGYGEEPAPQSPPSFSLPEYGQPSQPGPPAAQPPGYDSGYGAPPPPYGPTSGAPAGYGPTSGVPGGYDPTSGAPASGYGQGGYPPVSGAPGYGPPSGPPAYGQPPVYAAPPPAYPAGYGPPPGGQAYGAAAYGTDQFGMPTKPGADVKAIVGMSLGIASAVFSFLCFCFYGGFLGLPLGIAALILGFLARKSIAESGGAKGGEGMALAGLITGGVGVVFGLISVALVVIGVGLNLANS